MVQIMLDRPLLLCSSLLEKIEQVHPSMVLATRVSKPCTRDARVLLSGHAKRAYNSTDRTVDLETVSLLPREISRRLYNGHQRYLVTAAASARLQLISLRSLSVLETSEPKYAKNVANSTGLLIMDGLIGSVSHVHQHGL